MGSEYPAFLHDGRLELVLVYDDKVLDSLESSSPGFLNFPDNFDNPELWPCDKESSSGRRNFPDRDFSPEDFCLSGERSCRVERSSLVNLKHGSVNYGSTFCTHIVQNLTMS